MKKNVRIVLIIGAVAVAAYLAWRWYENRQANADTSSPTGQLGTNLNSVAPELVGGSSGPTAGPAVAMPLNITLTETAPAPQDDGDGMKSHDHEHKHNPVHRQRHKGAQTQPNPGGLNIPAPTGPVTVTDGTQPNLPQGTGAGPFGGGMAGVTQ